jgi:hypothetical protein
MSRILTQEGQNIFTWLKTKAEKWATEVPSVLWSLRTSSNRSTNFTPFLWCMAQRPCCPQSYSMDPRGSRPITQLRQSKHDKTPVTYSKSQLTSPSQDRQSTSKCSDGITPEGSPLGLPSMRLGPTPSPNKEGQTQVDPAMGGVILGG